VVSHRERWLYWNIAVPFMRTLKVPLYAYSGIVYIHNPHSYNLWICFTRFVTNISSLFRIQLVRMEWLRWCMRIQCYENKDQANTWRNHWNSEWPLSSCPMCRYFSYSNYMDFWMLTFVWICRDEAFRNVLLGWKQLLLWVKISRWWVYFEM